VTYKAEISNTAEYLDTEHREEDL